MDQRKSKTRKVNVVNPEDYTAMYLDGSYFREYAERKGYLKSRTYPIPEPKGNWENLEMPGKDKARKSNFREYAERRGYGDPRRDPQAKRDASEDLTKSGKPEKAATRKSIFDHHVLDTRLISRVDHRRDRRTKNKKGPQKQKEK